MKLLAPVLAPSLLFLFLPAAGAAASEMRKGTPSVDAKFDGECVDVIELLIGVGAAERHPGEEIASNASMTPNDCYRRCRGKETVYFGVRKGTDCVCFDEFVPSKAPATCDVPCSGNSSQICGGSTDSTYTVTLMYAWIEPVAKRPCGKPHAVDNSDSMCAGGDVVRSCNVSCSDGYRLASNTLLCDVARGQWIGHARCTKIFCRTPPHMAHSNTLCQAVSAVPGAQHCNVECLPGYDLVEDTLKCVAAQDPRVTFGVYEGRALCTPKICGLPPAKDLAASTQAAIAFPNSVTYTCKQGATITAEASGGKNFQISCQDDGTFSETDAKCLPIPCGPAPSVDRATRLSTDAEANGRSPDWMYPMAARYECDLGSSVDGTSSGQRALEVLCQGSGNFTEVAKCRPISCGAAPALQTARAEGGEGAAVVYGDLQKYVCIEGHALDKFATSRNSFVATCKEDGRLQGLQTCVPLSCGSPPNIDHTSSAHGEVRFPSAVEYTCDLGYTTNATAEGLDGFSMMCKADGMFESNGTCQPVSCGTPPTLNQSSFAAGKGVVQYYPEVLEYKCKPGYSIDRSAFEGAASWNLLCQPTGHFSTPTLCLDIDDCVGHACGPFGSCVDKLMNYTCDCQAGYFPNITEDGEIVCGNVNDCGPLACGVGGNCRDMVQDYTCDCDEGNELTMSGEDKVCTRVECGHVPTFSNSHVTATSSKASFGDITTYACDAGYTTDGEVGGVDGFSVGCLASGDFAQVATNVCKPITCAAPPSVSMAEVDPALVVFPGVATYRCVDGHTTDGTPGGNSSFRAQCGSTAKYSARKECVPVSCGPPPSIASANVVGSAIDGPLTYGQNAVFHCDSGYAVDSERPESSNFTAECKADGNFVGLEVCMPVKCKLPLLGAGGSGLRLESGNAFRARAGAAGGAGADQCQGHCASVDMRKDEEEWVKRSLVTNSGGVLVGGGAQTSLYDCIAACDKNAGCKSFTLCEDNNQCVLRDRAISMSDGIATSASNLARKCFSHFRLKAAAGASPGNVSSCAASRDAGTCASSVSWELEAGIMVPCMWAGGACIESKVGGDRVYGCQCGGASAETTVPALVPDAHVFFPATVSYECAVGHSTTGAASGPVNFQSKCGATGELSEGGACLRVRCGEVPSVPHAKMNMFDAVFGDRVAYKCEAGYAVMRGIGSSATSARTAFDIECLASGAFAPAPACANIDDCVGHSCGPRGTCVDGVQDYTCRCEAGFETRVLDNGEKWCGNVDDCGVNQCGEHGLCVDLISDYTCDCEAGYDLQSVASPNRTDKVCMARPCPNLPAVQNSDLSEPRDFDFPDAVRVTCDEGYSIDQTASAAARLFEVVCQEDGTSSTVAQCLPIDCGLLPHVAHASSSSAAMHRFTYTENADYTCAEGFTLDGTWTGVASFSLTCGPEGNFHPPSVPECKPVTCGDLPAVPNAVATATKLYFPGSAVYQCLSGYAFDASRPADRALTVSCTALGQLKAASEDGGGGVPSRCSKVTCGEPRSVAGAVHTPGVRDFGQVVAYSCAEGHSVDGTLQGAQGWSVTCGESGTYSAPLATVCQKVGFKVQGRALDATNLRPVASAQVTIKQGSSELRQGTDALGNFVIDGVSAGSIVASISASGYISSSLGLSMGGSSAQRQIDFSLSPVMPPDGWRVVLTWNGQPRDLDSHLYFGASQASHIFYGGRSVTGSYGISGTLDVDDTDGNGPETTTLRGVSNGCRQSHGECKFVFKINNYSRQPTWRDSGAVVVVSNGDREVARFVMGLPRNGVVQGDDWAVFSLDGKAGTVIACTDFTCAR